MANKDNDIQKQAYRPREFQRTFGVGKSFFYDEIAKGRLKVVKAGKATLVTREAASEWLALCASETPIRRVKTR